MAVPWTAELTIHVAWQFHALQGLLGAITGPQALQTLLPEQLQHRNVNIKSVKDLQYGLDPITGY